MSSVLIDDENESITISTNEELEIALEEMAKTSDIYKLQILLQTERDGIDLSKIEKILHPGVVCDVCDKHIRGFRFKCMQCRDYDLCTDCMTQGNHSQHYMVRMPQPVEWSSYHGRRLAHHVHKFMKKAAQHCKEDERRCPHKSKRASGCPMFRADGKFGPFDPSIVNSLENFVIDICGAPSDESHEQKRTKEQQREPSAEAATEATEDPQQEATRHSFSQLLKIVEDNISNISQFLDPLGINVTVMADNDSAKNKPDSAQTKANTQKRASNEPHATPSTSSEEVKKFPGEGKKLRDDPVSTAAGPSTNNVSPQKDSTAAAATAAVPTTTTAAAAASSAEQAAEAEEWTMIQRESSISRTSSTSSSSSNASMPKQVRSAYL